jgi:transposase
VLIYTCILRAFSWYSNKSEAIWTATSDLVKKLNSYKRYSPIERERAVRLVFDQQHQHSSQWSAIESIASKIGCTAETLRRWVRQSETDQGKRSGISSTDRDRLKELERENRELKQATEILRKAAAFFAQAECARQPSLRQVK